MWPTRGTTPRRQCPERHRRLFHDHQPVLPAQLIAGEPFGSGSGPQCMVEDPSDQFIYTANFNDSTVTGRVVDPNSGVLNNLRVEPAAIRSRARPLVPGRRAHGLRSCAGFSIAAGLRAAGRPAGSWTSRVADSCGVCQERSRMPGAAFPWAPGVRFQT